MSKKVNMMQTGDPLYYFYSGPLSHRFWERINALKKHEHMYSLGIILQNLEEYVVATLLEAEVGEQK